MAWSVRSWCSRRRSSSCRSTRSPSSSSASSTSAPSAPLPPRLAKPTETLARVLQTKGDVPFDERAALVSRAETLSVPFSTAYNYAHAFKIDSLAPDTGTEVNGQVVVPVCSRRPPKPRAKCAIAG